MKKTVTVLTSFAVNPEQAEHLSTAAGEKPVLTLSGTGRKSSWSDFTYDFAATLPALPGVTLASWRIDGRNAEGCSLPSTRFNYADKTGTEVAPEPEVIERAIAAYLGTVTMRLTAFHAVTVSNKTRMPAAALIEVIAERSIWSTKPGLALLEWAPQTGKAQSGRGRSGNTRPVLAPSEQGIHLGLEYRGGASSEANAARKCRGAKLRFKLARLDGFGSVYTPIPAEDVAGPIREANALCTRLQELINEIALKDPKAPEARLLADRLRKLALELQG